MGPNSSPSSCSRLEFCDGTRPSRGAQSQTHTPLQKKKELDANMCSGCCWTFLPVCCLVGAVEEVTEELTVGVMLKRFGVSSSFVSSSSLASPSDEEEDASSEESAKIALNKSIGGLLSSSASSSPSSSTFSSSPSPSFFLPELC